MNAAAAHRASKVLDDVWLGGAEDAVPKDWPRAHCLLFTDVLEHLVDPHAVLRAWKTHLCDDGLIVVSLPNVGYWSVARDWINGRWDYQSAGVLDRTHLRFFTRETAIELITRAGVEVTRVERRIDVPHLGILNSWLKRIVAANLELRGDGSSLTRPTLGTRIADLATMQYQIVARKI